MKDQANVILHTSHRERMRERAERYGFDSFSDHEILEMLLYGARARGDTNETAHRLIEYFGSFDAVMEADMEELRMVPGVGPQGALQISLGMETLRRCARGRLAQPKAYDTVKTIAEYFWTHMVGKENERLYVMLFDNRMSLLAHILLSEGTVNNTNVPKRELVQAVIRKQASYVVLAHNHPHGSTRPSEDDIRVTNELAEYLATIGMTLREHLIITDTSFASIMKKHCLFSHVYSDAEKGVGDGGFDLKVFYNVDEDTYRFPIPTLSTEELASI